MTRRDHLMTILAEECMEVAQRATKALRFGLAEVQPGQALTNAERIVVEVNDLLAALELLQPELKGCQDRDAIEAKKAKVEKFLNCSRECGTLSEMA